MRKNMQPDLRVKKTERAIRQALLELLQEKHISKITVRELTQRAEINKTTFYSHYETLDHLIDELEDEAIAAILSHVEGFRSLLENPDPYIDNFLEVFENEQITSIIKFHGYDPRFAQKVTQAILKELEQQNIDLCEYRPDGALAIFLFKGLMEIATTPEYADAECREYIKAFIRAGVASCRNNFCN